MDNRPWSPGFHRVCQCSLASTSNKRHKMHSIKSMQAPISKPVVLVDNRSAVAGSQVDTYAYRNMHTGIFSCIHLESSMFFGGEYASFKKGAHSLFVSLLLSSCVTQLEEEPVFEIPMMTSSSGCLTPPTGDGTKGAERQRGAWYSIHTHNSKAGIIFLALSYPRSRSQPKTAPKWSGKCDSKTAK